MIERASVDFCSKFCSHVRPLELSCRHTPETRTKKSKKPAGRRFSLCIHIRGLRSFGPRYGLGRSYFLLSLRLSAGPLGPPGVRSMPSSCNLQSCHPILNAYLCLLSFHPGAATARLRHKWNCKGSQRRRTPAPQSPAQMALARSSEARDTRAPSLPGTKALGRCSQRPGTPAPPPMGLKSVLRDPGHPRAKERSKIGLIF